MDTSDLRLGVILGSTRPQRRGASVAAWVMDHARGRGAEYVLVDLADQALPLLDEPKAASTGEYSHAHTRAWADVIDGFDGFVFVTPEYNHSVPAALKNAIDYLWAEWLGKAAALVTYGNAGGARSGEHLRGVLTAVGIAHVKEQVLLYNRTDFEGYEVRPSDSHERGLAATFEALERWAAALRVAR